MNPIRGQQGIHNDHQNATLVANGMIDNHTQLRRQHGDAHDFTSTSDSETILNVYEEHGLSTPRLLLEQFEQPQVALANGGRNTSNGCKLGNFG